jgi:hypothetical protein
MPGWGKEVFVEWLKSGVMQAFCAFQVLLRLLRFRTGETVRVRYSSCTWDGAPFRP